MFFWCRTCGGDCPSNGDAALLYVLFELLADHLELFFLALLQLRPELLAFLSAAGVLHVCLHAGQAFRQLGDLLDHIVVQVPEHDALLEGSVFCIVVPVTLPVKVSCDE
jgi:hypothetical protein